jgi:hypothetical protein
MARSQAQQAQPAARAATTIGGVEFTRRRIAAIVVQLLSWYTTYLFIASLGGSGALGVLLSIVLEWLLFEGRRELWVQGRWSLLPLVGHRHRHQLQCRWAMAVCFAARPISHLSNVGQGSWLGG